LELFCSFAVASSAGVIYDWALTFGQEWYADLSLISASDSCSSFLIKHVFPDVCAGTTPDPWRSRISRQACRRLRYSNRHDFDRFPGARACVD
ncbi:hypothetical protein DFH29DRAFT_1069111, partial [Suillus ampliporus]